MANRRAHSRHVPHIRAAVWFNIGIASGETCALKDVSLSGFSVLCDEWQLPVFLACEERPLYCVLLMGEAHFGCMAHVAPRRGQHSSHVGFHFDVIPDGSVRLLEGLIHYMDQKAKNEP